MGTINPVTVALVLAVISFTLWILTVRIYWAVVVVKWLKCSPSTLTMRVQMPLVPAVFSIKFVFEQNENNQKEAGVGSFFIKKSIRIFINYS